MEQDQSIFQRIREAKRAVQSAIDRLTRHRAHVNLLARDQRMHALMQKGKATSGDIYEADFGTKNPIGLDIVHDLNEETVFRDLTESPEFLAMSEKDRAIALKKTDGTGGAGEHINIHPECLASIVPSRRISNLLSHEHVHRRQGLENEFGWHSAFDGNEMIHVRGISRPDGILQGALSLTHAFNRKVLDWRAQYATKYKVSDYFSHTAEIQARTHEVMAQGYAEWQKMPTNKTELWAAMHGAGLKAPLSVLRELYTTKEGRQALLDFRSSKYLRKQFGDTINQLNYVYEFAGSFERKNILWRDTYPALYGNMLEQMGDRLGRERMEQGTSYQPALDVLKTMKQWDVYPEEMLAEKLQAVPADSAQELVNTMIMGDYKDHEQASFVVEALLARPDCRAAILDADTYDLSRGIGQVNSLNLAVAQGADQILVSLLKAGADPLKLVKTFDSKGEVIFQTKPLLMTLDIHSRNSKVLSGENQPDKCLRKSFEDADMRASIEKHVRDIERSAKLIVAHYPDIDKPAIPTYEGGQFKNISLRQAIKNAGIDVPSTPNEKGRKENIGLKAV